MALAGWAKLEFLTDASVRLSTIG